MKSAYELAMERLDKEQGKSAPVSEKQKKAIADIEQRMKASLVETEMLFSEKIAAATIQGIPQVVAQAEAEMKAAKDKIRDQAESEKEAVRRDESLA